VLALFGPGLRPGLGQNAPSELLKSADATMETVARLRGLEPKAPVAKGVKSRDEIASYLSDHVREQYGEAKLDAEGRTLQILGLIPPMESYREFVLKLLTEQVGGYYDPERRTFFIAGWLPLEQQKPVMAHELTHALQDQHFEIGRILKEDLKLENDDRALAHQALFEGDAMAVMLDYLLEPAGRNFAQLPDLVTVMRSQLSQMDSQFPVFKQAPMYLRETLLFPYGYGAAFLQQIRMKQPWSAVDKVYADLPASTEQILHPEKYLVSRDEPQPLQAEDPSARFGDAWKANYANVLGEFSLYILLRLHLPDERAKQATAGWDGDRLMLVEDGTSSAVFFSSVWDSPEEAAEYQAALRDWLKLRIPESRTLEESEEILELSKGGQYYSVSKVDGTIRLVMGVPEALAGKIR
jgi:hypothetical protein